MVNLLYLHLFIHGCHIGNQHRDIFKVASDGIFKDTDPASEYIYPQASVTLYKKGNDLLHIGGKLKPQKAILWGLRQEPGRAECCFLPLPVALPESKQRLHQSLSKISGLFNKELRLISLTAYLRKIVLDV